VGETMTFTPRVVRTDIDAARMTVPRAHRCPQPSLLRGVSAHP
jgi:hypothetical protein